MYRKLHQAHSKPHSSRNNFELFVIHRARSNCFQIILFEVQLPVRITCPKASLKSSVVTLFSPNLTKYSDQNNISSQKRQIMESLQNHGFDGFVKRHHHIVCSVIASYSPCTFAMYQSFRNLNRILKFFNRNVLFLECFKKHQIYVLIF